jgi:hypothetical protein
LVGGRDIMAENPAHAVRGPKHSVRKGKTPVLTAEEACTLLDSIPVMRTVKVKGGEKKRCIALWACAIELSSA